MASRFRKQLLYIKIFMVFSFACVLLNVVIVANSYLIMPAKKPEPQNQRSVQEEIEELKAKLALLEGDRKAYYESSKLTLEQDKKRVAQLRAENKELRQQLKDRLSADDHTINAAFQDKPREKAALANKPAREAIRTMDDKVCDSKKRLNQVQYETRKREKKLAEVKKKYEELKQDREQAEATETGQSEQGKHLRDLENRLDKATLKSNEAEHIRKTYEQILAKLQEEHLNFDNNMDAMELEMERTKREVEELKVMYNDAITCRDQAQAELKHHENIIYAERKKREQELQALKREADEKIQQHERIERRIAARSNLGLEDHDDDPNASAEVMEEQQQQITTYEGAFKRIKEATGVSDLNEVVLRFENQGSTREHLEQLKIDSENEITRLKEEKDAVNAEFNELKYTGEAKLSSGQRVLEEYQKQLADETKRRDDLLKQLDRSSGVLVKAKSGVGHLADKVTHIKVTRGSTPQAKVDVNSDEYVLDQLGLCEEKLLKLMDVLQGHDVDDILKKMQREEFHTQIENKLPTHNTRVKLPQAQRDTTFDDDEESGDEEGEVLTRQALKKQSQLLVDQKTKKRQPRKKKKPGK